MSDDKPFGAIADREITQKEITAVEGTLAPNLSPEPIVGATLAVDAGPETGRMLYVGSLGGVIGRADEADFTFSDSAISRTHAQIELRDGQFYVRDLGSVNGTFVDDFEVLDDFQLPPVCRIRVGRRTELQFHAVGERGREREYQRVLVEEQLRFEEEKSRALAEQAEELRRANADLEQLASVVSQDLQVPLSAVLSTGNQLADRGGDGLDATARTLIDELRGHAQQMQRLVDDLVAYSRIGSEGMAEVLDLGKLMGDVVAGMNAELERWNATVQWEALPMVMGNRTTLGQLLRVLLDNALKFRGEDPPQVLLTAEQEGGYWVISLADNGIGLPEGEVDRIFGMFQRLHDEGRYPGTGVGLTIAKKIVEQHGGRIWAESDPGPGASFRFTLPSAFEA